MPSPAPRNRYRPASPIGLGLPKPRRSSWQGVVAAIVHLILLSMLIKAAPLRNLEYQDSTGDPRSRTGGGGGGGARMIALPALAEAARAVVPPPPPVPVPPVKVAETPPVPAPTPAVPDTVPTASGSRSPGDGSGKGPGSGSGTGSGSGSGDGPGSGAGKGPGGGEGGKAIAPEPRQLILPPPDVPKALRGVTISVTFMVDPEGRVDQVRFSPEPEDRGFARKLDEVMRSYRFRPARGPDGQPVPGKITVELTF